MSPVSGVISRQVLPACGGLCFFCPAMRARSRQPVKRYKKLITDIFTRSQDGEPNDRMIGKLCEYATKNPLRIPKITSSLEQRCYKDLRSKNVGSAKIVIYIYRKLLVSCKEQISLFANSLLSIMHALLDQTDQDEMLIIGSHSLFDFINNQKDGTYMSNLEGFIPKLCQMAQEGGDDERAKHLRAAGLQALSAMVCFMGEYSNISIEFDDIVSVVLENYGGISKESNDPNESHWVQEVCKFEGHDSPSPEVATKVPSWRMIVNAKGEHNMTANPCFWSRVCLHNMAKLGKEAATMRRVLESLFRYFDNTNQWPADHGIALPVLKDMQLLMEDLGHNTHCLLSILVKHLDHKNVLKQPEMQLDIVSGATSLVRLAKVQSSVAFVTAMSDVMRHMRKSIQYSLDDANLGAESIKWNRKFYEALDDCLTELSYKVGDADPILDVMAVMLENISSITVIARSTVFAVYRTALIVASIPNLSYQNKAFPEALFHQLLPAMVHPDHETRVGAHRIFSVVLVPSSVCPQPSSAAPELKKFPRTLSRTVSVFSSSAALFEKLRNQRNSSRENLNELNNQKSVDEEEQLNNNSGMLNRIKSTYSQVNSFRSSPAPDVDSVTKSSKDMDAIPLRLSSHHITLLLSSIWAQSISPANMPETYEAIAHTYSLVLLFSRAKNSRRDALIQSFQLAFSLQSVSLAERGPLPPSRRRSLYVLSASMIIFASKAYSIPIVPCVKAMLSNKMVDPFLCLVKDCKLQTVDAGSDHAKTMYGSKEDDNSALKCLSEMKLAEDQNRESLVEMKLAEDQNRESLVSVIVKNLDNLSDFEESTIHDQLLKEFKPDDVCPMGAQLFTDTPNRVHQPNSNKHKSIEKASSVIGIEYYFPDSVGSSFAHDPNLANEIPHFMSVDQLLESVLETAQEVGRLSVCTGPDASYNEMANHCESLLMGKQQKMSLINRHSRGSLSSISSRNSDEGDKQTASHVLADLGFQKDRKPIPDVPKIPRQPSIGEVSMLCAAEYKHHPQSFMLPASSPYDNFLKAAGC